MSNEQVDMCGKLRTITLPKVPKVPKLLQTLITKEGYASHYLVLKLYHELGMKLTHRGKDLQLRQSHWIAPFVDLNNTRLQKAAVNKLQENFHKLIVTSAFGETMETNLERKKLGIVKNENELLQKTALSTIKSFHITDDQ